MAEAATSLSRVGGRLLVLGAALELYSSGTAAFSRDRSFGENLTRTFLYASARFGFGMMGFSAGAATGGTVGTVTGTPVGGFIGALTMGFAGGFLASDLADRLWIQAIGL